MTNKIAILGAGSIEFTRKLLKDILTVPELEETTFALVDIDERNLRMVTQLVERDIAANKKPARVVATGDRRRGLEGADYVLNLTRIGGLEAFQLDVDIPLKYGVDQCVGDTICAGGIMYAQRNVPQILAFCRDIREVSQPDVVFMNYANPNAINTWAANRYGGVNTIGLCHGVAHGHAQIAEVIALLVNGDVSRQDPGYVAVTSSDVHIICAGINHQTWYIQVLYAGQDWTGRLLEGFERHPVYSRTEKVRIDVLRRFGYYSTESNGHLSEYLPWYRKRPEDIMQWIDLSDWIHGETGGYLRVCTEGRDWFETDYPQWLSAEPPRFIPANRSTEHCSYIIEALETGRLYRGHFNVLNRGVITNLPEGCVVEVPCYVDASGISVPRVGDLPHGCAALCNVSIGVQRLALEAAVSGDVQVLTQAMMLDPLVGAVCTTPEISQMVDEMLIAEEQWLPQYHEQLSVVRRRQQTARRLGTRITDGAARVKVRTAEQLKQIGGDRRIVALQSR